MGQAAKRRCPGRKSKLFFSLARAGLSNRAYLRLPFLTNQKKEAPEGASQTVEKPLRGELSEGPQPL